MDGYMETEDIHQREGCSLHNNESWSRGRCYISCENCLDEQPAYDVDAYNDYYFWRQGMSMVWYSAEVAGTIIVQSIPLMRPLMNEMHTSLASRKLGSGADGTNRKSYGPGKSLKSTKRRTLNLLLMGCDMTDDENNQDDKRKVNVDRMHLTQDENGKIVMKRRDSTDEERPDKYPHSYETTRRLDEEEMGLTQDENGKIVMRSEYYGRGEQEDTHEEDARGELQDTHEYHTRRGLQDTPKYYTHRGLENTHEYHVRGELQDIPEYHAHG